MREGLPSAAALLKFDGSFSEQRALGIEGDDRVAERFTLPREFPRCIEHFLQVLITPVTYIPLRVRAAWLNRARIYHQPEAALQLLNKHPTPGQRRCRTTKRHRARLTLWLTTKPNAQPRCVQSCKQTLYAVTTRQHQGFITRSSRFMLEKIRGRRGDFLLPACGGIFLIGWNHSDTGFSMFFGLILRLLQCFM